MAINAVLVGKGTTTGTSLTTASGTTSATGSTFVYLVSYDATVTSNTPTDSKSNVYVKKSTTLASGTGDKVETWVCENGTGGSGHTATQTFSGNAFAPGYLVEITGATTTPTDVATNGTDASSPFTIATGTLAQANEVVVTICMSNQSVSGTNTYSSSNTTILSQESNGAQFWTSAVSAQVVASTASFSPSFTDTQGTAAAMIVLTFKEAAGGGATLTAASGTYALTGEVANLGRGIQGANGTYALTGQAATLSTQISLSAATGTYSMTGEAATLSSSAGDITLLASAGNFAVTGAGALSDLETPLSTGAYALTGEAIQFGQSLPLTAGTYALTGEAATLSASSPNVLTAACGTYALTGEPLTNGLTCTLAQGAYALSGQSLTLGRGVSLSAGSYSLTGESVILGIGGNVVLALASGQYALIGQAASFTILSFQSAVSFDLYEVSRGTVRLYFSASLPPTRWDIILNQAPVGTSAGFSTDVGNLAVDTDYVLQVQAVYPFQTVQSREIPYRYGSTQIAYVQTPPGPVPAP